MNWFAAPFRILAVAALCIAALIGLVLREGAARTAGAEIVLAMEPIDPRAILSGHYVIVSLQEPLSPGEACPPIAAGLGPETWVAIAPYETRHRASGAAPTQEDAAALGPITARGRLYCGEPTAIEGQPPTPGWLRAELIGPGRFYINQGEAERIDRLMRASAGAAEAKVFAVLSIGRDGRARLKGLIVEGERLELGWT